MTSQPISGFARVQKRESLRASVGNALRAAIVSGAMAPGQVYSAPALAGMLGVSPTPVREAMLDLVREGMVASLPNKGYRVTEISDADLDAITDVRLLLEPPVIAAITPNVPAAALPGLRQLADDIVTAVEHKDLASYIECDRVFHLALLDYAGNPVLNSMVSELRSRTRLLGLKPLLDNGELELSAREHHQLLDLIEGRDAAGASSLMIDHIGHVRNQWAGPRQ